MIQALSGKIFWVSDTFTYLGVINPKKDSTHAVAKIDQIVIEEHIIKFFVEPFEWEGETWSYVVNMLPIDFTTKFKGTFVKENDSNHSGEVTCEVFLNKNGYLLYGQWTEIETVFTFWVKIVNDEFYKV